MEIVAIDIGGTHARFSIATLASAGQIVLGDPVTLRTADYVSFRSAWDHYLADRARTVPRAVAIAVAAPIDGPIIKFTNNPWALYPARLAAELGIENITLINDLLRSGML